MFDIIIAVVVTYNDRIFLIVDEITLNSPEAKGNIKKDGRKKGLELHHHFALEDCRLTE